MYSTSWIREVGFLFALAFYNALNCDVGVAQLPAWESINTQGLPTARHEAALAEWNGKIFLIGGRRINPVDEFDPATLTWTKKSRTPIELHHFQAVSVGDAIYLIGAMTGGFPAEKPLEKIVVYYPATDKFDFVHSIPESRRRGGAGAALYKNKIYVVGGITNGHIDGFQPWFDEYDPQTGIWQALPDAPHARDHFQAVVVGNRLYAFAGRTTSQKTNQTFELTVPMADVFDFTTGKWLDVAEAPIIPTPRAGNMALAVGGRIVIGGGESGSQAKAHREVEVYDPSTNQWSSWSGLQVGRHGSGFVRVGDFVYTASGSGNRGGGPELTSTERLRIEPSPNSQPTIKTRSR